MTPTERLLLDAIDALPVEQSIAIKRLFSKYQDAEASREASEREERIRRLTAREDARVTVPSPAPIGDGGELAATLAKSVHRNEIKRGTGT